MNDKMMKYFEVKRLKAPIFFLNNNNKHLSTYQANLRNRFFECYTVRFIKLKTQNSII